MMFPLGDDISTNVESDGTKKRRCICKVLGVALMAFLMIGFLVLMTEPIENTEDEKESADSDKKGLATCEIKLGEKTKEVSIPLKMPSAVTLAKGLDKKRLIRGVLPSKKMKIRTLIQKEIQSSSKLCSKVSRINPEQMRSVIKEEIKKQQKTYLKPDFASASAGGMVLSASPTWTDGYSYIYFLFIPIRSTAPAPSILLEPTRQPGDCWPMKGKKGSVILQLAARANIVGFTMEHIDPAMSLSGATPEAPHKFSVFGLVNPDDPAPVKHLFGTYAYDNKRDEEIQYFRVQNVNRKSFLYVELEVASNHGNEKYTCIYRFQVHGFIDRAYHCQNGS